MMRRSVREALGASLKLAGLLLLVASCHHQGTVIVDREGGLHPIRRTVDLVYAMRIRDLPSDTTRVQAFVPVPPSDSWQKLEKIRVEGDWPYTLVDEPEYNNRFLAFDLPMTDSRRDTEPTISLQYRVTRKAGRVLGHSAQAPVASEEYLARFLKPDGLVPTTGAISLEAKEAVEGARGPLEQSRRIYEHLVSSLSYDKTGQGWGRGDALYMCDIRRGNCTDFHSLFIGELRSLGIPARFVMGLPLPEGERQGEIPGYHCWAEFYLRGRGWIPVDASEAQQHPEKREELFGGLDENRVAFTIGRDIQLPGTASGRLNYVIYPYVEVDGRAYSDVETRFEFKDVR